MSAIVAAAGLELGDDVLEIGPGLGVLTLELARAGANVTSVELDRRLEPALRETLAPLTQLDGAGAVLLRFEDAMKFDMAALPEGVKLVANLPYNVATPLVMRALESGRFSRLVFLVQREVADRLRAAPGTAAYGALSLYAAHFGDVRVVRTVPPGAFFPPPKVTSAVVRVDVRPGSRPDGALFRLIREGFAHRRKTLRKNLEFAGHERDDVLAALLAAGLDPSVRAEALDLATFGLLRDELEARGDRA